MGWKAKLWFANAGANGAVAMILALAGSTVCFAFMVLACVYWQFGEICVRFDMRNTRPQPTDRQGE